MEDIVPGLLESIDQQFDEKTFNSQKLKSALKALQAKKATYKDVNEFAIEVGEILADVLQASITAEILPDGKMYFNIADRILNPAMKKNFELISNYSVDVQTELNHRANLHLKGQVPELNQDRIDGIINRVSSEADFDSIKWILEEPIVNFSQSIVDDAIKKNVEFHSKAGLSPKITRNIGGYDPCKYCNDLAGTYDYYDAPEDIYRRHDRCRCTVEYDPKDSRGIQNSHTKKWRDSQKNAKIEARKGIGLSDIQLPKSVSAKAKDIFAKHEIPVRGKTAIKSGSTITKVNIIAGKGVKRKIDDVTRLVKENPGTKANEWQKVTGIAEMSNDKKAEVHWYQAPNIGKIEFKVKRWL